MRPSSNRWNQTSFPAVVNNTNLSLLSGDCSFILRASGVRLRQSFVRLPYARHSKICYTSSFPTRRLPSRLRLPICRERPGNSQRANRLVMCRDACVVDYRHIERWHGGSGASAPTLAADQPEHLLNKLYICFTKDRLSSTLTRMGIK